MLLMVLPTIPQPRAQLSCARPFPNGYHSDLISLTTTVDAESNILPVAYTREALFAFTQTVVNSSATSKPLVYAPIPAIRYTRAPQEAGADTYYLNCMAEDSFVADLTRLPQNGSAVNYCNSVHPAIQQELRLH